MAWRFCTRKMHRACRAAARVGLDRNVPAFDQCRGRYPAANEFLAGNTFVKRLPKPGSASYEGLAMCRAQDTVVPLKSVVVQSTKRGTRQQSCWSVQRIRIVSRIMTIYTQPGLGYIQPSTSAAISSHAPSSCNCCCTRSR